MHVKTGLAVAVALSLLAGCTPQETLQIEQVSDRTEHPLPPKMQLKLAKMNLSMSSPIMIRVFKEEEVMEVWKANSQDRYQLVATYPICAWSGMLGPKKKEGDRQAPEGFYNITPGQMNPNSQYYLSFDIGYPNKYDRAYGRSGRNIMVHGACASAGCYSMSDAAVLQIYAFARDAFRGGQKSFQVQAFPFRMTADNMAKHRFSENYEFWKNIKTGYDYFEITHRPPEVDVCARKYVFNQVGGCNSGTPAALTAAYTTYSKVYDAAFATASAKYDTNSWKDTPEFERKAKARLAKRMGRKPTVENDAEYVVVDPSAKLTPTSDTVPTYSAAYAKVEARKNGTEKEVIWLSVAEVEARKKAEEAERKEAEKLAKRLAKAKIPVPEANPTKPVEQPEVATAANNGDGLSLLRFWEKKHPAEEPATTAQNQVEATPVDMAVKKQARADDKKPEVRRADDKKAAEQPVVQEKAETATTPEQDKPFWKFW
jgi:murein L,D-transpeptidase YafK